jgi:hypothetical protein
MADSVRQESSASVLESAMADFQAEVSGSEESSEQEEAFVEEEGFESETPEDEDVEDSDADEDSAEGVEEEDDEEESEPELPDVEYVKADGKKVKIDYNNRDHIKRVYQKAAAGPRYQKERDDARSELAELKESHSKQSEMIDLLNENIEDPAEMYRLFTGGKDLKDLFKEWQKENDSFALLSEPEQKAYLNAKAQETKQKELDKREAALNRKVEESVKKESDAELKHQEALFTSAFEKYRVDGSDPADTHKLDKLLFTNAKERLLAYEEINKEIINKEVKDAAEELRSLFGRKARKEAKKAVAVKKKKAKKAVAKAVTVEQPNEASGNFIEDLFSAMNPMK